MIGWWLWNVILAVVYVRSVSTYAVRDGFTRTFGTDALWWLTLIISTAVLICLELGFKAIKRNMIVGGLWQWPPWKKRAASNSVEEWHLELWQELEQVPEIKRKLEERNTDKRDEEDADSLAEIAEEANIDIDRIS